MEAVMAVRIKSVQATEIKDKKIARQIIKQILKPISPDVIERNRKIDEFADKFLTTNSKTRTARS
jgi:type IV secretory pathway ATPase VirB11/archaellum biosynthesis ATPase